MVLYHMGDACMHELIGGKGKANTLSKRDSKEGRGFFSTTHHREDKNVGNCQSAIPLEWWDFDSVVVRSKDGHQIQT